MPVIIEMTAERGASYYGDDCREMPVITDDWREVPVIKLMTAERANSYYRDHCKVIPVITEIIAK